MRWMVCFGVADLIAPHSLTLHLHHTSPQIMDVLKSVLAARQDKSPQVSVGGPTLSIVSSSTICQPPTNNLLACASYHTPTQVQALLDCLTDPAFNLSVCICSVGESESATMASCGCSV